MQLLSVLNIAPPFTLTESVTPTTPFYGYFPPNVTIFKDNRILIKRDNRIDIIKDNRARITVT